MKNWLFFVIIPYSLIIIQIFRIIIKETKVNLIKQRNQQDNRNSTNELANKLAVKEREREISVD